MSGDVIAFAAPRADPDPDFEDFFENGAVGLHIVAADGTIVRANRAELDMLGYSADEYIGRSISEFHADPAVNRDILTRLRSGEKLDKYPARLRAKDGTIRDVLITSSVRFVDGAFVHTRCFTIDVTEAKKAQDELREREAHFRQLLDALPAAIYTTDAQGIITYFNRAAVEFSGRVPAVGRDPWCVTWRLLTPDGQALPHDQCPMAVTLREGKPVRNAEAIAERPDGVRVPFMPYPTPLTDINGTMTGAVNMLVDLSQQKEAEARQNLLVRELHHRVKNTLATVQGIVSATMRHSESIEDFHTSFVGRIAALSKAHALLTEDVSQSVDFAALLKTELSAYDEGERIVLRGPRVMLSAQLAGTLGIAIHELTTNAVKYGALAFTDGKIVVEWTSRDDALEFTWQEINVRHVTQPQHSGFGSQLLTKVLPQQFLADVTLEYAEGGLKARCVLPLNG